MPRDQRLYTTFPIDFHRHPKIRRLSTEAKWVFVEMNGEARIEKNDGRFSVEDAEFMWPVEVLTELTRSHPLRPLVVRDDDGYLIRDYSEHQFTTQDQERLAQISRENGAKGGRPPKPKETHAGFEITQSKPESESESGLETGLTTYVDESSHVPNARLETDSGFTSQIAERLAGQAGIIDANKLADVIRNTLSIDIHWDHLAAIVNHLVGKSKTPVKAQQAYAIKCIRDSPAEVQKFIFDSGLA